MRDSPVKMQILSIGGKPPGWVRAGFDEYAKRMPRDMSLSLVEVPAPRHGADANKNLRVEGERMLARISSGDWVIALDTGGQPFSSEQLADQMEKWRMRGSNITFVIGGADGLADDVRTRADQTLSLSALTFPHYLVRLILAETLYRAWSIFTGHPYHRA